MRKRMLWVVEARIDGNWWPTVGAKIDRADGRKDLRELKRNHPGEKFRLVKYLPEEK